MVRLAAFFLCLPSSAFAHVGMLVADCGMDVSGSREKIVLRHESDGSFSASRFKACGTSEMTTDVDDETATMTCLPTVAAPPVEHRVILDLETGIVEISRLRGGASTVLDRGTCTLSSIP
jgi:hypothetical protein